MSFDPPGNMTADRSGTGTHTYQWDAEARLSSVDKNSGITCGTGTSNASACYDYNALGQRVQGTYGGASYAGSWEWLFDVNGEEMDECDAAYDSGGRCWSYSWVRLGGRSIADFFSNSSAAFNHVDNLGTTTLVTAGDGTAKTDLRFYPYGQVWLSGGSGTWDVHFAGMQFPETNFAPWLMPTPARKYDPPLGRWLSTDPAGAKAAIFSNPQSWNLYAYVTDNPTDEVDPSGECGCDPSDPYCGSPVFGPPIEYGTITINFSCPDNRGKCCGYYDYLQRKFKHSPLDVAYAKVAKVVCNSNLLGCYFNCVRFCLVQYGQQNCDGLSSPAKRVYCREVTGHAACFTACAPVGALPSSITFTVPVPIDLTINVVIPFDCGFDNVHIF